MSRLAVLTTSPNITRLPILDCRLVSVRTKLDVLRGYIEVEEL